MAALRVATPWPKHAEAAVPKNPVRKSLLEVSMLVALKTRPLGTTHCVEIDSFLQYKKDLPIDNLRFCFSIASRAHVLEEARTGVTASSKDNRTERTKRGFLVPAFASPRMLGNTVEQKRAFAEL